MSLLGDVWSALNTDIPNVNDPSPSVPTTSSSATTSSSGFNEGLALFVTFAILFLMSTNKTTAKFALVVGISLVAIVWLNAVSSGQAKLFWNALAK